MYVKNPSRLLPPFRPRPSPSEPCSSSRYKRCAPAGRPADAIDPAARTLLVELQADNADNKLLPGGYAEVHIALPTMAQTVRAPINTLLFRSEGLRVAKLAGDDKVQLVPITMGRDYGTEVEVLTGLAPGDRIVLNPPDSLGDGQQVRLAQPSPAPQPGATGQNQGSASARTAN